MTVEELLDRVTSAELSEWVAFDNAYGLPDLYFATGQICAVLAGVFASRKSRVNPADFVPFFDQRHAGAGGGRQTVADHRAMFMRLAGVKAPAEEDTRGDRGEYRDRPVGR